MTIEIKNLNIYFNEKTKLQAVNNLSFYVKKGEILGLVGESGCGKSLISLSIMRLLRKNASLSGEINFLGKNILNLSEKEMTSLRGKEISMIFQEPLTALNPLHRVGKQIGETLKIHTSLSKKEIKEKTLELMNEVNLKDLKDTYKKFPHELSGGQRQRIVIAMAIACEPKLIIADEPTTALDVSTQAQIIDLLKEINKKKDNSLLFISHDLDLVESLCHRIAIMYAGHLIEVIEALGDATHPYTKCLLEAIPNPLHKGKDLYTIPGRVPTLSERESGCPFAARCSLAKEKCHKILPELLEREDGHLVRCFYI
ncbi:ABC transporter ATP-binding protein [Psychrilyobacter sp.]|uniref:ABC transporter ATP-binding protein n=1 Tax=Psychrilyobacter sp. TaxID=2586924 RepID=UPI0030170D87